MDLIDIILLIGLMAGISVYGLYKSLVGARQTSTKEVLHGAHVSILSSALSVCSGFLSAISLLGFPAEIYYQGTMFYWYGPMYAVAFPIVAFLYLPVFHNLKITSIYEYLEMRFNFACRFLASLTFCLQTLLYISVALYAPALALSSITSIPLSVSIVLTAGLSALYVSLGGAKAGIHTSSLQMALIFLSMAVIITGSLWKISLRDVITTASDGGRLQFFDFRVDPRIRHSAWALMIGGTGNILSLFATNQLSIQRYMAMPSLNSARWVVLLNVPFNILVLTMYVAVGLIIYHAYSSCHPMLYARDRLFPYYVVHHLSMFPGLTGLFAAAIYSAGISTLSASYSALATVVIEDVIKQYLLKVRNGCQLSTKYFKILARLLPLVFCASSMALAYCCGLLETMMLQVSLTIFGVAGGPVLSVFTLGMFFPYIKGKAAFIGQLCATLFCSFIAGGALISHVRPVVLPLGENCDSENITKVHYNDPHYGMVHPLNSDSIIVQLFRISYQYYSIVALITAIIVAYIAQVIIGEKKDTFVREDLLSPLLQQAYKKKNNSNEYEFVATNTEKEKVDDEVL